MLFSLNALTGVLCICTGHTGAKFAFSFQYCGNVCLSFSLYVFMYVCRVEGGEGVTEFVTRCEIRTTIITLTVRSSLLRRGPVAVHIATAARLPRGVLRCFRLLHVCA